MARLFERENSLCFNSVDFERESFDADVFVATHGRLMDLDSLLKDLKSYHKKIKTSLIEVINSDYEDFVQLSKTLITMESNILEVDRPLSGWEDRMKRLKADLTNLNTESMNILSEKKQCKNRKDQLIALKSVYTILNSLERALFDSEGQKVMIDDIDILKRLSLEISSLSSKLSLCDSKSVGELVLKRAEELVEHFLQLIRDVFVESVEQSDESKFLAALEIYSTVEKVDVLYDVYRGSFVAPYLQAKITSDSLKKRSLDDIFQDIFNFFPDKGLFLVRTAAKSEMVYNFEINSIFAESVELLIKNCSQLFIPVNWRQFGSRYRTSMQFLSKFEELFHSYEQVQLFRSHKSYQKFCDKWSLPVYFQLVFQEFVSKIENCISHDPYLLTNEESGQDFWFSVPEIIFQCFSLCWSDEVYINNLCNKFVKLSVQLANRLLLWAQNVESNYEHIKELRSKGESDRNPSYISDSKQINTNVPDRKDMSLPIYEDMIVYLICDLEQFLLKAQTIYDLKIYREVKQYSSTLQSAIDPFKPVKILFNTECEKLRKSLIDRLVDTLSEDLKPISETPRLYRKTNRPAPETESAYITKMVSTLQSFFTKSSYLGVKSKAALILQVADQINFKMRKNIEEICESVEKIEQSLKKIRSSKSLKNVTAMQDSPGDSSASALSDSEKIYLQLYLDVGCILDCFNTLGVKCGVKTGELESTKTLSKQIEFAAVYRGKVQ